jgi:hypothetical protein
LACAFLSTVQDAHAQPLAPERDITGQWLARLDVDGVNVRLVITFHRRGEGNLLGYVMAGTYANTIVGGHQGLRGPATFDLELRDPRTTRSYHVSGTVSGGAFTGYVVGPGGRRRVFSMSRQSSQFYERRLFVAFLSPTSDIVNLAELAVLRTAAGALVTGSYTGRTTCGPLGCSAAVTGYSEGIDSVGNPTFDAALRYGGACPSTARLQLTFDPAMQFYTGSYSSRDCSSTYSGDLIASGMTRTTSRDARSVLITYARIADDLERGATFAAPYAPFSTDYLHLGEKIDARLDELNEQVATYADISVNFNRFRNLHTVDEPVRYPLFARPFGVDFDDRRAGNAGGGHFDYHNVDTQEMHEELRYLTLRGRQWVIHGSQVTHDLPLRAYNFNAEHIVAPTAGGDIYVSVGPWGAHSLPHTGHFEGNIKADWMGYYVERLDQLKELASPSLLNGVCEADEVCGLPEDELLERVVEFVPPADGFVVHEVTLKNLAPASVGYYQSNEHWVVAGRVGPYFYGFQHLRQISAGLRDAMLAAGYADPSTIHTPSDNLITGSPVMLDRSHTIGQPQIQAVQVDHHPGYYMRNNAGAAAQPPHQQMEFQVMNGGELRDESYYEWLPRHLRDRLAALLQNEGLNPESFRYRSHIGRLDALWRAEMALSNQKWSDSTDYSSLLAALGSWPENPGDGCSTGVRCDSSFSIFPISKHTAFYDPTLYEAPAVNYLVTRGQADGSLDGYRLTHFGEVLESATPDPVAGSMVLKWTNAAGAAAGYQSVSYRLDSSASRLRIAWGPTVATRAEAAAATPPIPTNDDACDGELLTCHSR